MGPTPKLRTGLRKPPRAGRSASLLLLGAFLFAGCAGGDAPPNIVLMIGDDHGFPDFGFTGSPTVKTPHLDALARTGSVFLLAHTTGSECRPSLMTLLTGLHPYQWCLRVGELERADPDFDETFAITRFETLPRLLAARGYASFQGGKHWEGTYEAAGFSAGMTEAYEPDTPWGGAGVALGRESMQPVYEFIDAHRHQPFFIWFAPMLPHIPHRPPQRILDLYQDTELSASARRYYASCTWYDELVGELVEHLEQRNLRQNTLLVYVSDNGWEQPPDVDYRDRLGRMLGGTRGKASLHDPGFRTPVLFNWPGRVPEGRVIDELVSTVDLVPTLLDYAGAEPRPTLPGVDLRPAIEGGAGPGRELIVGSVGRVRPERLGPTEPLANPTRAFYARSRDWHYVRDEEHGIDQLYDMRSGRAGTRNVADRHPEVVKELRAAIEAWKFEVARPLDVTPGADPSPWCAVNRGGH